MRILPGDGPLMACRCGARTRDPLGHLRASHTAWATFADVWSSGQFTLLAARRPTRGDGDGDWTIPDQEPLPF